MWKLLKGDWRIAGIKHYGEKNDVSGFAKNMISQVPTEGHWKQRRWLEIGEMFLLKDSALLLTRIWGHLGN